MSESNIFDHAIAAHARWKYRLYRAIKTGRTDLKLDDVRSDDRCELGEWLRSLPAHERAMDQYENVRAFHAEFHCLAAEVLALAMAGRQEEAATAIAIGSRFSSASTHLTTALSAWKETASVP